MPDLLHSLSMKNGAPYEIRPCIDPRMPFARAQLKEEIRRGLAQLTTESRWQRFASGVGELSDRQLDYLADVDGQDRVAWCAAVRQGEAFHGIGLPDRPDIAEFAVTVIDEFQGQGVGRQLLGQLRQTAAAQGIGILRGYVLPSNQRMLRLCRQFGAEFLEESGAVRVDIPVAGPAAV